MRQWPLLLALLALALAGGPTPSLCADEVRWRPSWTRALVEGESFNLTITIDGPIRGSEAPLLPTLADFALAGTSSSSSFSF
jgi:hypothetical protein